MKQLYLTIISFSITTLSFAQNVGIGTATPNASAKLDITSASSGLLIPRVALTATNLAAPIITPATSLMVYNTATAGIVPNNVTPGYYYWDGAQWSRLQNGSASSDWRIIGNSGTNAASNFIGTTDGIDFVTRTNNVERMRVASGGNVGIGTATPVYRLDLGTGTFGFGNANQRTETRDNAGLQGNAGAQSGFFETSSPTNFPTGAASWWHLIDVRHSNTGNNYALQIAGSFFDQDLWYRKTNNSATQSWSKLLTSQSGWMLTGNGGTVAGTNFIGTTDGIDFVTKTNSVERMRVLSTGNVGIGTATPAANARLQVAGGSIMPQTGNSNASGIYFPPNPGGGGGDEAYIRHYVEAGENTKLVIANGNDSDDDIALSTGLSLNERMNINGNGTIRMNRSVFFDCNDCGSATVYDLADGAGGNFGDLAIQGRVLSTNSNLHLSPPGGFKVIINSTYRSAGGGTGTTGLDIEDGGIRMRKNYRYFQRYAYTTSANGVDAGYTYDLGNWDFCAVAQVGFKNNASASDEDDDVQCAVYPNGAGAGEQTNYDYYYTEQFNSRRLWYMYMEAYEDTNGVTCAASCWNLE